MKFKRQKSHPAFIKSIFAKKSIDVDWGLEGSYQISLLTAKKEKPHTIVEETIKPALSVFSRTVLQKGDDSDINSVPLRNDTVRRRIDEMATNVHNQFI